MSNAKADIRIGDHVVYRQTRARCETSGKVEKANRVNLALVAGYQLGAVGIGEIIDVRFILPRAEVDEIWRDDVKVFDSGRAVVSCFF